MPEAGIPAGTLFYRPRRRQDLLGGPVAALAWLDDRPPRPVVVASLGTAFNDAPGVWRTILAAPGRLPVNAVVALGPGQDPAAYAAPPNAYLGRWLPHGPLLARADAAVVHGGTGSTVAAFAAGVPVVAVPIAQDQPAVATAVAALGAGERLAAADLTADGLAAALARVLAEPRYRAAAERLASEIADLPDERHAVRALEEAATNPRWRALAAAWTPERSPDFVGPAFAAMHAWQQRSAAEWAAYLTWRDRATAAEAARGGEPVAPTARPRGRPCVRVEPSPPAAERSAPSA